MTLRSILLLFVVCLAVYSNSISNTFHYDDEHSIVNNYNIRRLDNVSAFFVDPSLFSVDEDKGMYRPLLLVSYAINYAISDALGNGRESGYEVEGYHVVNLLIHAVNATLVLCLASLVVGKGALVAALIFAVHPLCSEPVNYISSRSESLAALFYLLSLVLYGRSGGEGSKMLYASWASGAMALLCKATAITLPGAILIYDFSCRSNGSLRQLRKGVFRRHVPFAAIAVLYLVVITANSFLTRSVSDPVRGGWSQFLTQAKAFPYYVTTLFMPVSLSVEPQFDEQLQLGTMSVIVIAFVLSVAVLLYGQVRRHWGRGLFLLGWGLLALAPVMIFPLNVLVNERRLYLSVAAFSIALGCLLAHVVGQGTIRAVCIAACGLVLSVLTTQRNLVWADDFSLWTDAIHKAPLMPRNHLYLGNAHKDAAYESVDGQQRMRHWEQASTAYQHVVDLDRSLALSLRAINNLGSVHWELRDYVTAEKYYRQAVDADPSYADGIINLGSITLLRGRTTRDSAVRRRYLKESVRLYERALELRPNHYQAHGNLGVVYQDLGELDKAERSYRRSLVLKPTDWKILKNVGKLYLRRAEQSASKDRPTALRTARSYFQRSLRQNPNYGEARKALAHVDALIATERTVQE